MRVVMSRASVTMNEHSLRPIRLPLPARRLLPCRAASLRPALRRKQGFTLVELIIVVSVLSVLNGVGILVVVRYLSVQSEVSARAQIAVQNHLFLCHLREDTSTAGRVLERFQDLQDATGCLILQSGSDAERVVVYRTDHGQLQRQEYQASPPQLLSERRMLSVGQSVSFDRDPELPRLLWVEVKGKLPDRAFERTVWQRAVIGLPSSRQEVAA